MMWLALLIAGGCSEPVKDGGGGGSADALGVDGSSDGDGISDADGDADTDADIDADIDADTDTDSDTDTDTDADTDSDTDADTEVTADTGEEQPLDCYADYLTDMPLPGSGGLGECVTQELQCDTVYFGTNSGAESFYDYDDWFLTQDIGSLLNQTEVFDGPDRSYLFRNQAADQNLTVTVESCVNMWAFWLVHGDVNYDTCRVGSTGGAFETGTEFLQSTTRLNESGSTYDTEFVLEALDSQTGNYKITVECH